MSVISVKPSEVIVIGGMNIDLKGQSFGELHPRTSNPGRVETSAGGVGRNIAANLALLGVSVTLLTVAGTDPEGEGIIRETAGIGVDMSHIRRIASARTGTYIALLDYDGEMQLGLSDMSILEHLSVEYLQSKEEVLVGAKYILCDTNIPKNALAFLAGYSKSSGIPLCVEPVSIVKSRKVTDLLDAISLITPNRYELQALTDRELTRETVPSGAEKLIARGVRTVVTTLGKDGLCCSTKEGSRFYGSYPADVVDVTGAGDALTAGFIYGLLRKADPDYACKCGLAAAALAVASENTVSHCISEDNIRKIVSG